MPLLLLTLLPLTVTVIAGLICLPICKWLDSHDDQNGDN